MREYRAVFLDRDGTLVRDVHFCRRVEDLQLLPGVPQAVRLLNEEGFRVVVITNQSGIGRGYLTRETLAAIHKKLGEELGRRGAVVDAIYYCPHHPEEECECRKPRPGLFLTAIRELGVDPEVSYVVGDRKRDLEPGRSLGCKAVLVNTGPTEADVAADFTAPSLLEAVRWIIGDGSPQRNPGADSGPVLQTASCHREKRKGKIGASCPHGGARICNDRLGGEMKPEETRKLIDALNQDVSLELGAVIQYLWHHYMAEGMESPAVIALFEKLSRDEMKHLELFAERVVALGGEPTTQIAPIKKGGDLKKMVRDDLEGERNAIQVYKGHIRLAAELGDTTTRRMLEEVVATEEDHAALWETALGIKPGE